MYRSSHSSCFNISAKTSFISHSQKFSLAKVQYLKPLSCVGLSLGVKLALSIPMVLLLLLPAEALVPVVSYTLCYTTALKLSHQLLSPFCARIPSPLALLPAHQPGLFPEVLREHNCPRDIHITPQKRWAILSFLTSGPTTLVSLCSEGRSWLALLGWDESTLELIHTLHWV